MFKRLPITSILFLFIVGCSLYESDNRKAIAKNAGGIVVLMSGIDSQLTHYYVCSQSTSLPEFLKEPLEVVESPLEPQNYSVLFSEDTTPQYTVVYPAHDQTPTHEYCKVYMINQEHFNHAAIMSAARLGIDKLTQITR